MKWFAVILSLALVACVRKEAASEKVTKKDPVIKTSAKKVPANKSEVLIGPGAVPLAGASQSFGTKDGRFTAECRNKDKGFHCELEFPKSYKKRKGYFCFAAWVKCVKGNKTESRKLRECYRFDKYSGPSWFGAKDMRCDRTWVTAIARTDLRKKPWTKKDWHKTEPGTVELKLR